VYQHKPRKLSFHTVTTEMSSSVQQHIPRQQNSQQTLWQWTAIKHSTSSRKLAT